MKIATNTLLTATLLLGFPTDATGIKLDRNGEITDAKTEEDQSPAGAPMEGGRSRGVKLTMDADGNLKTETAPITDRNGQDSNNKGQKEEEPPESVNGDSGTVRAPSINLNNLGLRPTGARENASTNAAANSVPTEEASSSTEEASVTSDEDLIIDAASVATSNSTESVEEEEESKEDKEETLPPCEDCKEIPFYCDLRIDFFEGEGKEPSDEEALSFVDKTEEWMNNVLSDQSPTLFHHLEIGDDLKALYDASEPDAFAVEFSTVAFGLNQEDTLTIENVYEFVQSADYMAYITDYIWETPPFMINVFYHAHAVKMACYGGLRPSVARAAKKLALETNDGERRLRGAAKPNARSSSSSSSSSSTFGGQAVAFRSTNNA